MEAPKGAATDSPTLRPLSAQFIWARGAGARHKKYGLNRLYLQERNLHRIMAYRLFFAGVFFLLLSFSLAAQSRLYELSGHLGEYYEYQGGAARAKTNIEIPPTPLRAYSLYIVRLPSDEKSVPKIVAKIHSDESGNFKTRLPAGKYGFVEIGEADKLKIGQYLPAPTQTGGIESGHIYSVHWSISPESPLILGRDKPKQKVSLTRFTTNTCMICP